MKLSACSTTLPWRWPKSTAVRWEPFNRFEKSPGFLALLVVYVMLVIREHRLAALSVVLLGIGIAVTGLFPSYAGLLATTLLMSFGFYYYEAVNQSISIIAVQKIPGNATLELQGAG